MPLESIRPTYHYHCASSGVIAKENETSQYLGYGQNHSSQTTSLSSGLSDT